MNWGAIGAAWGTLLAGLTSGSISFVVSQYYYKIGWEYGKICCIFFLFFGSAITFIALRHLAVPYEFRILLKPIPLFAYLYLGVHYGFLSRDNINLLRKIVLPVRSRG
jgi:hypothetical protein